MRSKLWLSLCVLHAVASMLVWWMGERLAAWMIWRADDWDDRPWSLWTANEMLSTEAGGQPLRWVVVRP